MRGKVSEARRGWSVGGITPAYAGKSATGATSSIVKKDHPRLCGEKFSFLDTARRAVGSPPPMRGKGKTVHLFCSGYRITPAYAGKSLNAPLGQGVLQDHPRLCGEKCRQLDLWGMPEGSPPPMRGKGHLSSLRLLVAGITPAYAGKSYSPTPRSRRL